MQTSTATFNPNNPPQHLVQFQTLHQKLNGTLPTDPYVSCDRAIRYSGFFGVRIQWVLLEISWKHISPNKPSIHRNWFLSMDGTWTFSNLDPLRAPGNASILILNCWTVKRVVGNFELKTNWSYTLPETNIAPENRQSQEEIHFPTINFQVRAVSFREGILFLKIIQVENDGTWWKMGALEDELSLQMGNVPLRWLLIIHYEAQNVSLPRCKYVT